MPRHHVGLKAITVVAMSALAGILTLLAPWRVPAVQVADSFFSDREIAQPSHFLGAVFVPPVAPLVTVVHHGSSTTLTWASVVIPGGTVSYVVRRISPNGSAVIVCTGLDTPVLQPSGQMLCVDGGSGGRKNLSYSQQPVVVRDGVTTWSLAPSTPTREH